MTTNTRTYVGFRLNRKEDADIIHDEAKYNDRTQRWKDVYRKVMLMESGSLPAMLLESSSTALALPPAPPSIELAAVPEPVVETPIPAPEPVEPLVWKFPTEEPRKKPPSAGQKPAAPTKANVLANIKQGF